MIINDKGYKIKEDMTNFLKDYKLQITIIP